MDKRIAISKHFSPLRYPGGKGKLAGYIKRIIEENDLFDCDYVEPYAGGAAVALELLAHEYVLSVHINDISRPIYSFWKSALDHTDELCRLVRDTDVTVDTWDEQRATFLDPDNADDLQLGFATFFLNRTNRSGILNGGIIGGRNQASEWGIDARYNKSTLIARIRMVGEFRDRIVLTSLDSIELIESRKASWRKSAFVYLDPPYYNKGKHLYYDFYSDDDHKQIARQINKMKSLYWVVSYDNHPRISELFHSFRSATYDIGYSAHEHKVGEEVMFFSPKLVVPNPINSMRNFLLRTAA